MGFTELVNRAGQLMHRGISAMTGPYRGGEIHRLNRSWQPDPWSPDAAIGEGWDLLVRRVLDLERNDPAMIALSRTLTDHVVSTGIQTAADATVGDEWDEEFNFASDDEWEDYAEQEVDFRGELAWADMQRQLFREMLDTGEALLLRCRRNDPERMIPLCYQTLEAEQLDSSKDQLPGKKQNAIKRGVELDRHQRPVAYWLFDVHPGDTHAVGNFSRRVLADRVIHVKLPGRPSQTRGMSLYSSITQTAKDLDNYLGAELTAANIAALFTLVHKTEHPGRGIGFMGDGSTSDTADQYGNPKVKLGRGIVSQIGKNDELEAIEAKRPNRDARVFTDLMLMLMGMGGNVSRQRLTRDYTKTSYVAARATHLDDKAAFRPLQLFVGRQLCLRVRRDWTAEMIAMHRLGGVSAGMLKAARRRWLRLKLMTPGWEQIDEEKETDAAIARVGAGMSTLEEECARTNKYWRRVLLQRKREEAFAAKLGVEIDLRRPSTPRQEQSQEPVEADADE